MGRWVGMYVCIGLSSKTGPCLAYRNDHHHVHGHTCCYPCPMSCNVCVFLAFADPNSTDDLSSIVPTVRLC